VKYLCAKFTGNNPANHFKWAKSSDAVASQLAILPMFHLLLYVHAHEALPGKGNCLIKFYC
jgi:hypothetical protein